MGFEHVKDKCVRHFEGQTTTSMIQIVVVEALLLGRKISVTVVGRVSRYIAGLGGIIRCIAMQTFLSDLSMCQTFDAYSCSQASHRIFLVLPSTHIQALRSSFPSYGHGHPPITILGRMEEGGSHLQLADMQAIEVSNR